MDVADLPSSSELSAMSPAALEVLAHGVEVDRRRAEARSALLLQRVESARAHTTDGHRRVAAWGCATNNWSGAEAARQAKLARAMSWLPQFAAAALAGSIGVAQMQAIAALAANPRVREFLDGADELFTQSAQGLPFDDFVVLLRHWEELADADGARSRHDRAEGHRRASLTIVGERAFLEAAGAAFDGVMMRQVLDQFRQVEWRNEWDAGVAEHGEGMHPGLMPRTHSQRTYDALRSIFAAAAGSSEAGGEVVVNIVVDEQTFSQHLEAALGGDPAAPGPEHAAQRRCEDARGAVVDPRAVVAAAMVGQVRRMVLAADGVVLDFGRKRRLFTGPLREAVLLSARHCLWPGCDRPSAQCDADHLHPHARHGPTSSRNGGPLCQHHNVWKNQGYRVHRDPDGLWHTYRPDGTEIGWPVRRIHMAHLPAA